MFYVQRYPQAIMYLIASVFFMACMIVPGAIVGFQYDFMIVIQTVYNTPTLSAIFLLSCVAGALALAFWIADLIRIIFKNFKVPVVLKEK